MLQDRRLPLDVPNFQAREQKSRVSVLVLDASWPLRGPDFSGHPKASEAKKAVKKEERRESGTNSKRSGVELSHRRR